MSSPNHNKKIKMEKVDHHFEEAILNQPSLESSLLSECEMDVKEETPLEIDDYEYYSISEEEDFSPSTSHAFSNSITRKKNSIKNPPVLPLKARCTVCQQIFKNRANAIAHFNSKHPGFLHDVEFKCRQCDEFFETPQHIRIHSQFAHPAKEDNRSSLYRDYICNVCKKLYRTTRSIKRHFTTKHPNYILDMKYKCRSCVKLFDTNIGHRRHWLSIHKYQAVGLVEHNNQDSTRSSTLSANPEVIEQDSGSELDIEIGCMQCEEFFKTVEELKRHTKLEHDGKPTDSTENGALWENYCNNLVEIEKVTEDDIDFDLLSHSELFHELINGGPAKNNIEDNMESVIKEDPTFEIEDYNHCSDSDSERCQAAKTSKSSGNEEESNPTVPIRLEARCTLCQQIFKRKRNAVRHSGRIHPGCQPKIELKCGQCEQFFETPQEVRKHSELVHKATEDRRTSQYIMYTCGVCKKPYTSYYTLQTHLRNLHPGVKFKTIYKCRNCKKIFKTTVDIRQHWVASHVNKDNSTSTFIKNSTVQDNARGSKVLDCEMEKDISDSEFMIKHEPLEDNHNSHPEKEIIPSTSSKSLSKSSPKEDIQFEFSVANQCFRTPKVVHCNLCDKYFSSYAALPYHFYSYHPGSEIDAFYKCTECDDIFKTERRIKKHLDVAHDKKTYRELIHLKTRCNRCNLMFSNKRNVIVHFNRKHSEFEEPDFDFKCRDCDRFFKTSKDVRMHSFASHGKNHNPLTSIYGTLICSVCKKLSPNYDALEEHFQDRHPDLDVKLNYKCRSCVKLFKTTEDMKQHWLSAHGTSYYANK